MVEALRPLADVGLGYIRLGQPLSTLSGGEAQRLKLSRYLRGDDGRRVRKLFIFDEPTTGLHFEDIRTLLGCLQRLVDAGHSVLVIEHNMDVVKTADWVIDLGPEGGDAGGEIVAAGPPERVSADGRSHTGRFLKIYLDGGSRLKAAPPAAGRVAEPAAAYPAREPARMIDIKGAREHNLKDIHLSLPHNQLVVLTGVSGSGKSTLAFDILFAEGQRRYLESLAPYVRQYMKIMERPDVDLVTGLAPTVAIEQRISHASRRSTVATLTETYHFLRLLYSKLGTQHCPGCDRPLTAQTQAAIVEQVRARYGRRPAKVLALKVLGRKGFHKEVLERAVKKGFTEARIDGNLTRLSAGMALSRYHEHTIELVAGSLPARDLDAFIARSLDEGGGHISVIDGRGREEVFSLHGICPACGIGLEPLDPRLFSFNSKQGACPACNGLGVTIADEADEAAAESPMCRTCGGSRLKAQALAVKIGGRSIWDLVQRPAGEVQHIVRGLKFPARQKPVAEPVVSEILTRLDPPEPAGARLPVARPQRQHAFRRRGPARAPGRPAGLQPHGGLLHPGRAHHRPAPPGQPRAGRRPENAAGSRQHHHRRRARRGDHPGGRHHHRPRTGRRTRRRQGGGRGRARRHPARAASVTGALIDGHGRRITSRLRPWRDQPAIRVQGASANNLRGSTWTSPWAGSSP